MGAAYFEARLDQASAAVARWPQWKQSVLGGLPMKHKQVMVPVLMPVDEGVVDLVRALNQHGGLVTVDSCQCDERGQAYVCFSNLDSMTLLGFISKMSEALGAYPGLVNVGFTLSLEYYAGGSQPLGYVRVPSDHVKAFADAIEHEFKKAEPVFVVESVSK